MQEEAASGRSASQGYNVDLAREVLLEKDGIEVLATRDRLGAFLRVSAEAGPLLSNEELREVLKEARITTGLRPERVSAILAEGRFDSEQLVAWGRPPKRGEEGQLEFAVQSPTPAPAAGPDKSLERIDYRRQSSVISVKKGDLLVRRVPAVPGASGVNVHGQELLPPPVREARLPKGKNTEADPDGLHLYATIDGLVCQAHGVINVSPIMEVRGDVDFSVGSIDFKGSVNISGNVLVDFEVKAQDDITIAGVVEGATLIAGGNLTIARGVQGGGKAKLQAGGVFSANFIHNAAVAANTVAVAGPILHCRVRAEDTVVTTGSKGTIAGGKVSARYAIECTALGTELGVRTELEVGIAPQVREQLAGAQQEMRKLEAQMQKLAPALAQLRKAREELGDAFPEEHTRFLENAEHTRESLEAGLARLEEQRNALLAEDERHRRAEVVVRGEVYPGVQVRIYDATLAVQHAMKALRFVRDSDGQITARSLS